MSQEKKLYTKEECRLTIEELVKAAQSRKDLLDVPRDFTDVHPWSVKYLSHFSEANGFFHFVRLPGITVREYLVPEKVTKFRKDKGMRSQIKFEVVPWIKEKWHGGEFIFTFEEQADGLYVSLNW